MDIVNKTYLSLLNKKEFNCSITDEANSDNIISIINLIKDIEKFWRNSDAYGEKLSENTHTIEGQYLFGDCFYLASLIKYIYKNEESIGIVKFIQPQNEITYRHFMIELKDKNLLNGNAQYFDINGTCKENDIQTYLNKTYNTSTLYDKEILNLSYGMDFNTTTAACINFIQLHKTKQTEIERQL